MNVNACYKKKNSSKTLPTPNFCYKLGKTQNNESRVFGTNSLKAIWLQLELIGNLQFIPKNMEIYQQPAQYKKWKIANIVSNEFLWRVNHRRQKGCEPTELYFFTPRWLLRKKYKIISKAKLHLNCFRPTTIKVKSLKINKTLRTMLDTGY